MLLLACTGSWSWFHDGASSADNEPLTQTAFTQDSSQTKTFVASQVKGANILDMELHTPIYLPLISAISAAFK